MSTTEALRTIPLEQIAPWPGLNPRRDFPEAELLELARSIAKDGLLQPVSVAPAPEPLTGDVRFWLFAGERRLRASAMAERTTITAIVHNVDEATAHRLAGIENLDREGLTAIEEASWLSRELELSGLSQAELGEQLGKSQGWIANRLRLLELPAKVRELVHDGTLAPATARDLLLRFLTLEDWAQAKLWKAIAAGVTKAAKEETPIPMEHARELVEDALEAAGAVRISSGHHWLQGSGSAQVPPAAFKAFLAEHVARSVQSPTRHRGEEWYTFDAGPWRELVKANVASARDGEPRKKAAALRKKAATPDLGPDKPVQEEQKLAERFGWDNVVPLEDLLDFDGVEPASVARVSRHGGRVDLVYVGPDARARRSVRSKAVDAAIAAAAAASVRKNLKAARKLKPAAALRALLDAVLTSELGEDLEALIAADGHEIPETWNEASRFDNTTRLADVKLDDAAVVRLAGALASVTRDEGRRWERRNAARNRALAKLEARGERARDAWLEQHGFGDSGRNKGRKAKAKAKAKRGARR